MLVKCLARDELDFMQITWLNRLRKWNSFVWEDTACWVKEQFGRKLEYYYGSSGQERCSWWDTAKIWVQVCFRCIKYQTYASQWRIKAKFTKEDSKLLFWADHLNAWEGAVSWLPADSSSVGVIWHDSLPGWGWPKAKAKESKSMLILWTCFLV